MGTTGTHLEGVAVIRGLEVAVRHLVAEVKGLAEVGRRLEVVEWAAGAAWVGVEARLCSSTCRPVPARPQRSGRCRRPPGSGPLAPAHTPG